MKTYPYDAPIMSNDNRIAIQMNIEYAKAKMPADLPRTERLMVEENIKRLLKAHDGYWSPIIMSTPLFRIWH